MSTQIPVLHFFVIKLLSFSNSTLVIQRYMLVLNNVQKFDQESDLLGSSYLSGYEDIL